MENLWRQIREIEPEMIGWRRDIHAHPEPGFEEVRTAGLVAGVLEALGLKVRKAVGKTGVVADLEVGAKTRVALRADMDALRMTEENDVPYRSQRPGVAHMCGHDAHVAMLLATAKVLAGMKKSLAHNVRFIFQPCEECPPGGAIGMLDEGALEGVDEVYAIHMDSSQPAGTISMREGVAMASADEMRIVVEGKGGHGSAPQHAHDPVVAAAEVIMALQTIVSRRMTPTDPAVVSVCQVEGGTAFNIIPSRVTLRGTFRTVRRETRERIPQLIEEIATAAAKVHGCKAAVEIMLSYPMTVNHAGAVQRVRAATATLFKNTQQVREDNVHMGGEDFSLFLERGPGAIVWLGSRNQARGIVFDHHHPRFDVDESGMVNGVALFCELARTR